MLGEFSGLHLLLLCSWFKSPQGQLVSPVMAQILFALTYLHACKFHEKVTFLGNDVSPEFLPDNNISESRIEE